MGITYPKKKKDAEGWLQHGQHFKREYETLWPGKTSEDEFSESDTETRRQQAAAQKQVASKKLLGTNLLGEGIRDAEPATDEESTPTAETTHYCEPLTIRHGQPSRLTTTNDDSINSVSKDL